MLSRRQFVRACLASAAAATGLAACHALGGPDGEDQRETLQSSFFCFDTMCVIGGTMGREVLDQAVARCQGFERTLSRTLATSDVGRVNAAGGVAVAVQPETAELVSEALRYCEESGGLFDITIGAVSELWDFHEGVVPSQEAIARARPHVGWQRVRVDLAASTIALDDSDARLDLGGIAKGYVTDVVLAELAAAGVESAFVNLGGNVGVLGPKADGSPWGVGVRDPQDETGERSVAVVRTQGGSVVTSGLYERRFEQGGRDYWHILDPRTGYPAESDLVSASIYAPRSLDGDGYTKPLFMLGLEGALAFLEERGLDGLLIDDKGAIHTTVDSAFEVL